MHSAAVFDPRLKRSRHNNKVDTQEVEHQHHYAGGKRRIGRRTDIDQQAAATSSKELDASLQAEQLSFAREQASTGIPLTPELQQALANQQLQGQAAEIRAHIDALQISVALQNRTARRHPAAGSKPQASIDHTSTSANIMAGEAGEAASGFKKLRLVLRDPGNASAQQWNDSMWRMLVDSTRSDRGVQETVWRRIMAYIERLSAFQVNHNQLQLQECHMYHPLWPSSKAGCRHAHAESRQLVHVPGMIHHETRIRTSKKP